MASFLASAGKAISQNFGAYIIMLQKEEHLKRQQGIDAKREANAQTRWSAQQEQSAEQHKDNLAMQGKRLKADSEHKKDTLAQREVDQAMSMYNSYEKEKQKQITKIESDTAKEVRDLMAMGQKDQALILAEQAESRINSLTEQYDKVSQPYRNKLVQSGYLSDNTMIAQDNSEAETETESLPPESIATIQASKAPPKPGDNPDKNELYTDEEIAAGRGSGQLMQRPSYQNSFDPTMDRLIENNRLSVNDHNLNSQPRKKHETLLAKHNSKPENPLYKRY